MPIKKSVNSGDHEHLDQAAFVNINCMFYSCLVSSFVSLACIIVFAFFTDTASILQSIWRNWIIICHLISVTINAVFALISFIVKNKKSVSSPLMRIVPYFSIVFYLVLAIGIVTIDQLVTPSITPFLILCILIALFYLLKPLASIIIFLSAYLIYYFSIEWTQFDHSVLMSNRVNGMAAVGIGISLSIILWKFNKKNFLQRKLIENQNRELEQKKAELEVLNAKLSLLASSDSLTGLLNRREFEKVVQYEILNMRRFGNSACLLMADIDHFKRTNDRYGHPAGDEVLRQFSAILQSEVREVDLTARVGGEEFALMLPNTPAQDGLMVAERIRTAVESCNFMVDGKPIRMTASFGVAELLHTGENPLLSCYQKADKALYMAKNKGRNRCVLE